MSVRKNIVYHNITQRSDWNAAKQFTTVRAHTYNSQQISNLEIDYILSILIIRRGFFIF
jgi:hypothetical protein